MRDVEAEHGTRSVCGLAHDRGAVRGRVVHAFVDCSTDAASGVSRIRLGSNSRRGRLQQRRSARANGRKGAQQPPATSRHSCRMSAGNPPSMNSATQLAHGGRRLAVERRGVRAARARSAGRPAPGCSGGRRRAPGCWQQAAVERGGAFRRAEMRATSAGRSELGVETAPTRAACCGLERRLVSCAQARPAMWLAMPISRRAAALHRRRWPTSGAGSSASSSTRSWVRRGRAGSGDAPAPRAALPG